MALIKGRMVADDLVDTSGTDLIYAYGGNDSVTSNTGNDTVYGGLGHGDIYAIIGDNGVLFSTTDVIDTYVFRSLRYFGDFGTTAAIGLFQSVVGFVLVVAALLVQRKFSKESSIL